MLYILKHMYDKLEGLCVICQAIFPLWIKVGLLDLEFMYVCLYEKIPSCVSFSDCVNCLVVFLDFGFVHLGASSCGS